MIDLTREKLITLGQAASLVPARGRRRTAAVSVWRWTTKGFRGVHLEAVRRPSGDWLTSAEAVGRFLARIASLDLTSSPPRDLAASARHQWAEAELDAAGISIAKENT